MTKHANEILTSGRFELARMLLRAFDECRIGQSGTMTWVDSASHDLTEAHLHLDHEGVKNYYRRALRYPIGGVCLVPPPGWWCSRPAGHSGPCAARSIRIRRGAVRYMDGI